MMSAAEEDIGVRRPSILIVEDHPSVRNGLRDWLGAALPDCRVLEAASGEDAVALFNSHRPDIVVMDIGLPRMNGIETTRRIKAIAPQTHVVILTILESWAHEQDAAKAGATAYILKRKMATELMPVLGGLLCQDGERL